MDYVEHVKPKQDDSECKFHHFRGTNLYCQMLCEPTRSDNYKKEGDNLSANIFVNINKLTTNMDKILVYQNSAQEKDIQMKRE